MATLTVQNFPANGQPLNALAFVAADVAGDEFANDGRTIFLSRAIAGWTVETAQVEGVPSADSGRDGTSLLNPGAIGEEAGAGMFKPRNWNAGAVTQVTYPSGITGLEVAAVRIPPG